MTYMKHHHPVNMGIKIKIEFKCSNLLALGEKSAIMTTKLLEMLFSICGEAFRGLWIMHSLNNVQKATIIYLIVHVSITILI